MPGYPGRLRCVSMAARRPPVLLGRASERELLDRLLENVRGGQSAVLVIRGEAGVGKTALLHYCARQASGFRVAQDRRRRVRDGAAVRGAASALRADARPARRASRAPAAPRCGVALGPGVRRRSRPLPGRAGRAQPAGRGRRGAAAAVRRRRRAVARRAPRARSSASSRDGCWRSRWRSCSRCASRADERELVGLPELALGGLRRRGRARAARDRHPGPARRARPRPDRRRDARQPAGAAGAAAGLDGDAAGRAGSGCRTRMPLSGRIEESFLRRLEALPEDARLLLLVAAAEPVGDPLLLGARPSGSASGLGGRRAARRTGLLAIGERVTFRHPLVRSAVYRSAPAAGAPGGAPGAGGGDRSRTLDPDRRAWHLAAAPRRALTRRSPWSSSARPAGRRRAAGSPRRPRSWSARSR